MGFKYADELIWHLKERLEDKENTSIDFKFVKSDVEFILEAVEHYNQYLIEQDKMVI